MGNGQSRRQFLKVAGAGAAFVAGRAGMSAADEPSEESGQVKFKLGMASYTFREFPTEKTVEMTKRLGLKYICFKSMHLPLESSPEQIEKVVAKVREAGLELYAGGVIYMNEPAEVDRAFEYAKCAGMKIIVGVPRHELLEMTAKRAGEYDIKVAIHNHGPGDELYPTPESAYEKVKDLDEHMGLCIDIGHAKRSEVGPADAAEKYADRLYDVHIKDVDKAAAEGETVEIGRGVIDVVKFIRTLIRIGYAGKTSFEFEKDGRDPLPGVAESVGYVRGVLAAL